MSERDRFIAGVVEDPTQTQYVVAAALRLVRAMYAGEDTTKFLFRLRKSLEGIWGHDLPELNEYGEEIFSDPHIEVYSCNHDRLNEEGFCRYCGSDCRGI